MASYSDIYNTIQQNISSATNTRTQIRDLHARASTARTSLGKTKQQLLAARTKYPINIIEHRKRLLQDMKYRQQYYVSG